MRNRSVFLSFVFVLALFLCSPVSPAQAKELTLTNAEADIAASAKEQSDTYGRNHIVLVWPKKMDVNWYPESKVTGPAQLADWLEKCYVLCTGWLGIDPNRQLNKDKTGSRHARLMFIHNGMRDYNYGGNLPRPVIGLRDFSGVGSEDWFGWLTHELSHEFLLRFPVVTGTPEDNAWHEAFCDYLRYWLLKESGMPQAAEHWLKCLKNASPLDHYQGGANAIMDYHRKTACKSPADLWNRIKQKGISKSFGPAPWLNPPEANVETAPNQVKLVFEAVVDGAGSFTFRDGKIFYEHFTWQYPTEVRVNGKPWTDLDKPFPWSDSSKYASAKTAGKSGRNVIEMIPHQNRMVLFVDDIDNSSARYRITIVMDK